MSKEFEAWMEEFKKSLEYQSDSFIWSDMAAKAYDAGQTAAESRGRAQGLREAAGVATKQANMITPWASPGHDLRRAELFYVADAILSLIPSLTVEKGEERCEWEQDFSGDLWHTSCGTKSRLHPMTGIKFCPWCGKPITIE